MDNIEIPEHFLCPISLQIMRDPVTAITGITYDRESIEHWLNNAHNTSCPVTKQPLSHCSDLIPNHTLRRLIQSWCTANSSYRIPTPKASLSKPVIISLTRDLWLPQLQLKSLRKMEAFAMEGERNRIFMLEAGVPESIQLFVISRYKKGEKSGLEEALSILSLVFWVPTSSENGLPFEENHQIIDALTWVLGLDDIDNHMNVKRNAVIVLKYIIQKASSRVLEGLKPEFFERIVGVLRQGISQQGVNAALHVLLDACPLGRNRLTMIEAQGINELIEIGLGTVEKKTTELVLGVLFRLCSCADGRAQFLSHAGGMAMLAERLLKVSAAADDRAVLILYMICKHSGTGQVIHEMLKVRAVTKLCMVLQADSAIYLKERAKEILRAHSDVWKNSPCIEDSTLFTRCLG